jgi:outer membrane protein insertion porin family
MIIFKRYNSCSTSYMKGLPDLLLRGLAILIVMTLAFPVPVIAQTAPEIKMIELVGNRKIGGATIMSRIKSREGTELSKDTIQEDIKNLYSIGYFDDIRVEFEPFEGGVKLIYRFSEKPSVSAIGFEGNREIEEEDLKEHITINPGAVANLTLITDNARSLEAYYQSEGFWLAKVIPVIKKQSDGSVSLMYKIDEGPKVKVRRITINGNHALSDRKIKKVMKTRKWWILSFLTQSGVYSREQIKEDIARIKELYQRNGYIYATVSEPEIELSEDRKSLYLTLNISEGDQYSIGKLAISGNSLFPTEFLSEKMELKPGDIFNRHTLRKDIDRIIDLYMEKGYARADINPDITVDREKRLANIDLRITEGDLYRIGRIDISGNTKTRDKVIRREMRLDEGDIFNKKLLKRSYQRINNLNYFETVDISPMPRPKEKLIDLDIKVKEKLTGMLSIGGGYSSVDKFMVMGEVSQANLFGRGLKLRLKADFSSRRTNYNIAIEDPWFMDRPISASLNLYNEEIEYIDYKKKATGGSVGFGKEFTEYVGGRIVYNIERAEILDVDASASSLIKDQEGRKLTSSISPSFWRDSRDNYIDPTTGSRNAIYATIAGLGGDNYYYKLLGDSLWYFPAPLKTTFSVRGRVGYADGYAGKDLPLYERFYVGGINTIRGLGFGEGGPRNAEGEKIGGNLEMIANVELIFPIVDEIKLKGVIFYDYGAAFDKDDKFGFSDLRQTTGFGFRWMSPFGPIRLEWGYNIDPREDENGSRLEFSMGGVF